MPIVIVIDEVIFQKYIKRIVLYCNNYNFLITTYFDDYGVIYRYLRRWLLIVKLVSDQYNVNQVHIHTKQNWLVMSLN